MREDTIKKGGAGPSAALARCHVTNQQRTDILLGVEPWNTKVLNGTYNRAIQLSQGNDEA